jgi:glycosyltransferase involved in cell wall biosynthesis
MKMHPVSVIISFYRRADFLERVIASLEIQTFKDFEVIISDDGSPRDVVTKVKGLLTAGGLACQHVWHEDDGWRKNIILNKSVVASRGNYLIFIDGDCVLHERFVEEHYTMRKHGVVRAGRRVNLSPRVSEALSPERIRGGYLGWRILLDLLGDSVRKQARDLEQGVYLRYGFLRTRLNERDRGIKGCNFSLFKDDLLAVNGFDERFLEPAVGEDTDLEARLRRNGMTIRGIRNQAIQYHLYHRQLPRESEIHTIYEENNANAVTYTPFGISRRVSGDPGET